MNENTYIVEPYELNDNSLLIKLFIEVFHSEILVTLHTEDALSPFYTGIQDKKYYLTSIYEKCNFLLLGYANKPINSMIEDYEFYLYILSFFDACGKLYRKTEYSLDLKYKETVIVSYYNSEIEEIEVLGFEFEQGNFSDKKNVHLYFLLALKSIVYRLLFELNDRNIDIQKIILNKDKFLKLQERDGESGEEI